MILIESLDQFNEMRTKDTVFLFSAKWCPDCRFIEPFIPDLEQRFPQYTFAYVDRDQFIDVCMEHNIYGIPSFIVYKNNQVMGAFISKFRKTKEEIVQFLENIN